MDTKTDLMVLVQWPQMPTSLALAALAVGG